MKRGMYIFLVKKLGPPCRLVVVVCTEEPCLKFVILGVVRCSTAYLFLFDLVEIVPNLFGASLAPSLFNCRSLRVLGAWQIHNFQQISLPAAT